MQEGILKKIKDLDICMIRKMSELKNCAGHDHTKVANPTQVKIFSYLIENKNKDVFQRDLEEVLNLRRATISKILKKMETNGYILREKDQKDLRSKKIILTDLAMKRYQKGLNHLKDIENIATKNIENKDLEIFNDVIDKMIINIRNYDGEKI